MIRRATVRGSGAPTPTADERRPAGAAGGYGIRRPTMRASARLVLKGVGTMDHTNGIGELAAELAQLRAALVQAQAERDAANRAAYAAEALADERRDAATRRAEQAESKLRDFSDQSMPCSESDATAWVVYVPTRALDDWRSLVTRANRAEQAEALAARVDELTRWAAGLVEYRRRAGALNFQLEKADDYIRGLEKAIAALAGPEGGPLHGHGAPDADAQGDE